MGNGGSVEELESSEQPLADTGERRVPDGIGDAFDQERQAREDFAQLWEQCVPGGSQTATVSRPLMRELLLRATRELVGAHSRHRGAIEAELIISEALSSAQPILTVEDAFDAFQTVLASLPPLHGTSADVLRLEFGIARALPQVGHRDFTSVPKGARMVDSAPVREGGVRTVGDWRGDKAAAAPAGTPLRPTRAALESANARLRAALSACNAAHERLLVRAESIRFQLAHGAGGPEAPAGGLDEDAAGGAASLAEVNHGLSMRRVRAVSLQSELDRYLDRLRFSTGVVERQRREIAALREDCATQAQRAGAALRRRDETRDKLQRELQEQEDLSRKAKTEQLRAVMLREAFEQEQTRVGVSLGRAEAFVCDLVAATEGTRRMEVEEQSLARECSSALSEIQVAQAQEEAGMESRWMQLRSEMDEARLALGRVQEGGGKSVHSAQVVRATAEYAMIESQRHDVITELDEARRAYHAAATEARLRGIDLSGLKHKLTVLRARHDRMVAELGSLKGSRAAATTDEQDAMQAQLRLAEIAESSILAPSSQIGQRLARIEWSQDDTIPCMEINNISVDWARRYANGISEELERVRGALSEGSFPVAAPESRPSDNFSDLEAAQLQRKIGMALAREEQNLCRLQEESLQDRSL